MSCDINKLAKQYNQELDQMPKTENLSRINTCVQASIDHKLKTLVKSNEDPTYRVSSQKDDLTFESMNEASLELYSKNFFTSCLNYLFLLFCFLVIIDYQNRIFSYINEYYIDSTTPRHCYKGGKIRIYDR